LKEKEFDILAKQETDRMLNVMCSKSADYANDKDKLFNFKQAGRMDNVSPIEALRGMWLKHRASIQQGLDELIKNPDKTRSRDWWIEKLTDDRNYNLLLFALLEEGFFIPDGSSPGYKKKEKLGWHTDANTKAKTYAPHFPNAVSLIPSLWTPTVQMADFPMNTVPPIKKRTPFEKMLSLAMSYGMGAETFAQCVTGTCENFDWAGLKPGEYDTEFCDCCIPSAIRPIDHESEHYRTFVIVREKTGLKGWYVITAACYKQYSVSARISARFLHKDGKLHAHTGYDKVHHGHGKAPGYYESKKQAREYIDCHRMMKRLGLLKEGD